MPITGTNGPDVITGTNGNDDIFGLAGDDTLRGLDGNDTLDGGDGNDILTGGLGADILTGGAGSNIFVDTAADLNGDRITDFLPGDRIQFTDLTVNNANFNLVGSRLSFNDGSPQGGSLLLDNVGPGRLVIRPISSGGVEIRLQQASHNDFDEDGRSDLLLVHQNGTVINWLGQANGTFISNHANTTVTLPSGWHVAKSGDFNGDGRIDLLLRNDNGSITEWLGQTNGSYNWNSLATYGLDNAWKVAGTGDFNGDGRTDVLLSHLNGSVTNWLANADGTFFSNHAAASYALPAGWSIAVTGDFNGDGIDDVLLRNSNGSITEWLGQTGGSFAWNSASTYALPSSWHIAGVGDFDGDARSDVLLVNDNGSVTNWLGQGDGTFVSNHAVASYALPSGWSVGMVGDVNGDALDDVILRNTDGSITEWLAQTGGSFAWNSQATYSLPPVWHVEPAADFI